MPASWDETVVQKEYTGAEQVKPGDFMVSDGPGGVKKADEQEEKLISEKLLGIFEMLDRANIKHLRKDCQCDENEDGQILRCSYNIVGRIAALCMEGADQLTVSFIYKKGG